MQVVRLEVMTGVAGSMSRVAALNQRRCVYVCVCMCMHVHVCVCRLDLLKARQNAHRYHTVYNTIH